NVRFRGQTGRHSLTSRLPVLTQTGLSVARYFLLINRRPPTPSRVTICHQTDKRVRWLHAVRNEHGLRGTFELPARVHLRHAGFAVGDSSAKIGPSNKRSAKDDSKRPHAL